MLINRRLRWLAAALLTTASCRENPPAPTPESPAEDVKAVEAVLTRWYDAMQRHDSAGTAAPLTASFFIYEDTVKLGRDELLKGVVEGFGSGVQTAVLSDIDTRIRGGVAWSSFRNSELFTPTTGTPEKLDFLETVVFLKEDGAWKIDRYHATRINRPGAGEPR